MSHPSIRLTIVEGVFSVRLMEVGGIIEGEELTTEEKESAASGLMLVEKVNLNPESEESKGEMGCVIAINIAPYSCANEYFMLENKLYRLTVLNKNPPSYITENNHPGVTEPKDIVRLINECMSRYLSDGKTQFTIVNEVLHDGFHPL